jgi:site-specific DNA-methyltransferase (adenine-specific)
VRSNRRLVKAFRGEKVTGQIFQADALNLLKSLPSSSVTTVFLDPPFNLKKEYAGNKSADLKKKDVYEKWLDSLLDESARILKQGGALFVYQLPVWAIHVAAHAQRVLDFRHWIAVSQKNGFARGSRLYPAHYALLYLTKGAPKHFTRPKLRPARCRHCNEIIKDYGGYLSIILRKGINLSDIWEDVSPVRHASKKTRAENELPQTLVERVVQIAGRRGQVFVDPFCGGGGAVLAAVRRGMTFVAGDKYLKFAEHTARRIEQISTGGAKLNG